MIRIQRRYYYYYSYFIYPLSCSSLSLSLSLSHTHSLSLEHQQTCVKARYLFCESSAHAVGLRGTFVEVVLPFRKNGIQASRMRVLSWVE